MTLDLEKYKEYLRKYIEITSSNEAKSSDRIWAGHHIAYQDALETLERMEKE